MVLAETASGGEHGRKRHRGTRIGPAGASEGLYVERATGPPGDGDRRQNPDRNEQLTVEVSRRAPI